MNHPCEKQPFDKKNNPLISLENVNPSYSIITGVKMIRKHF